MYNYYDMNDEKYHKYFKRDIDTEEKNIVSKDDTEYNKMEIYKNKKKIMTYSYSILGKYDFKEKIWIWGWSLPIPKNQTYFIKKIFDYGYNIVDNNKITSMVKDILINSIIKIHNINFLLALSLYITKNQYIDMSINPTNKSVYDIYLIKDIEIL